MTPPSLPPGFGSLRPRSLIQRLILNEDLNFLLTNRIPRQLITRFIGWFSKIEQPLVRDLSIGLWKLFADLDLSDARKASFTSLHDCFIRQLRDGARPLDPDPTVMLSPCDAIIGESGRVHGKTVWQAKGFPYTTDDLFGAGDAEGGSADSLAEYYRGGTYVTLRLTSSMYHRFHAPLDFQVDRLTYISGDTWNVNPIALKRIERLFCKNERVVISGLLGGRDRGSASTVAPPRLTLVPVAAVLVASLRLHCLDVLLHLRYRGPNRIPCSASYVRGQEIGWFQHGSTIIVFAPAGFEMCPGLSQGARIRMGERLMNLPPVDSPAESGVRSEVHNQGD